MPCSRRSFLAGTLAGSAVLLADRALAAAPEPLVAALLDLERRSGGRLGVCVLEPSTGRSVGTRADERFAMCSTFKALLGGAILARCDRGEERLDRAVALPATFVPPSPVTSANGGRPMTLGDLCHATITTSDNTAANLLLDALGGPSALTAFLRGLGDTVTRLDRIEPELNLVDLPRGDLRDTTTPAAMAGSMGALTLGSALSAASRDRLVGWMRATVTGLNRLRAHLPADWAAGDKTGTGPDGPTNDVAVAWPPGRSPIVVAAYYERTGFSMAENATVLAEVGRLVVTMSGAVGSP